MTSPLKRDYRIAISLGNRLYFPSVYSYDNPLGMLDNTG